MLLKRPSSVVNNPFWSSGSLTAPARMARRYLPGQPSGRAPPSLTARSISELAPDVDVTGVGAHPTQTPGLSAEAKGCCHPHGEGRSSHGPQVGGGVWLGLKAAPTMGVEPGLSGRCVPSERIE